MIRPLVVLLVLLSILQADKVLIKALACPSIMILKKAPVDGDYLNLNTYAIANDCEILSKNAQIQAIGYDPRNSQNIHQQIIDKRTGNTLYILKSKIQVEQGGKKGIYRF